MASSLSVNIYLPSVSAILYQGSSPERILCPINCNIFIYFRFYHIILLLQIFDLGRVAMYEFFT